MLDRNEVMELIARIEKADNWSDIEVEEYENLCETLELEYHDYDDPDPVGLGKYSTREEAMKELKKYRPNCYYNPYGKFYHVTEYFIDCYEADEDGEFLSGCDYISAYEYKFDNEIDDIVFTEEKGE